MATKQLLENKAYIPSEWESVPCPICGANDCKLYERYGDKWQYTYVLCKNCNLVYQSPRPKYDDDFVHDAYEFYASNIESQFNKNPVEFYENEGAIFKKDLKDILKYDINLTSILEVGSYLGCLLYYAKPYYKATYGVEVSKKMAELSSHALNLTIFTSRFEEIQTELKFSCIIMSHVLEHIPNPNLWLHKSRELLTPEGILIISVPNRFSINQRFKLLLKNIGLRKGVWENWRTPDHLFEPTVKSMHFLFKQNEFEIIDFYTYSRNKNYFNYIMNRKLYWGSNLRFIVKPKRIDNL